MYYEFKNNAAKPPAVVALKFSFFFVYSVFTIINLLAFATFLVFVVVQALRSMREFKSCQDRTGLRTTHPELLDEHGNITKEELLVVRFGGW